MTDSTFNFFQHWYPISPIEDLDPERPTPIVLLGRRLVVWKSRSSNQYSVFLDQCPHRLAPLSEGRVDEKTGHLMCSYHGWQFDNQGACTQIPQADDPDLIAKNREHYCVTGLPTQEANGLLWVWADADSAKTASSHPLPLSPQVDASRGFVWSSMVRDLEYDWQTLIENVADPSHVPFAHHGVQGNRNRAKALPIKIVKSTQEGIEAKTESWKTAYKLPTSADRMVIEFRRWVDHYCQGQLPWSVTDSSLQLPIRNRQQLLDRYHQHTIICESCRQALKNVHRLQVGLLAYFCVALSVAAVMPDRFRVPISLPLVLTALLGLIVYVGLKYWLEPKFYFVDYVHADR
jgi:phenylpropionate dioxygenase-like ring-hydroxylating dioxygenase large terminal subunit